MINYYEVYEVNDNNSAKKKLAKKKFGKKERNLFGKLLECVTFANL